MSSPTTQARLHRARLQALSVPVLYAVFGCLWILVSDLALNALHLPASVNTRISLIKGWIFVAGSTLLITVVMRTAWASLESAYSDLETELAQRRLAQEELARLATELEIRVGERTTHLQSALSELAMFSDSISHDLRAPLRAVAGYAQALEEEYASCLEDTGRQYLERMKIASHRMDGMINGLLELSRHGRAALHLEDLDPTRHEAQVDEIWQEIQAHQIGRTFRFLRGKFAPLRCDPRLLDHVWRNLLSNAAKYTRLRETSRIDVDCVDGWYRIRDNGIGFDPASAERIFRPFERLHRADEFEGDGIGLALVHRVIERHGGQIEVDSRPGEGSEFRFRIPAG